jgi:membrane dipeptidase
MNRLNIIVDVSHLSEAGFWDVAAKAQKPFVATHSDSKALQNHKRNLSDGQFQEIVRGGGLVGLNFYKGFLGGNESMEEILRHAEHFLSLGGEKALAIGSDFDGCELAGGIRNIGDMDKLYEAMCGRFGNDIAGNIFYNNAYRFFTENLD